MQSLYCKCGKDTIDNGLVTCKHCGLVVTHRDLGVDFEEALSRIHLQLGTSVNDRSNDSILSQLG